jgi:hypothetical protein
MKPRSKPMKRRRPKPRGLVNKELLAAIRLMPCIWCDWRPPSEAAHILGKGIGGGRRIDVKENVVPLCRLHHAAHHAGHAPTADQLRERLSEKIGIPVQEIIDTVAALRKFNKKDPP